jgi:ParB family chromosome partitioning protein
MNKPATKAKGGFASLTVGGFTPRSKDVSHVIRIPVSNLRPNPFQVRKDFDSPRAQRELEELRNSIKEHGLQTPIHVQTDPDNPNSDNYIIVAGERRWRAMKMLGEEFVEAKKVEGDPETLALIENIQRADLSPVEEAEAYIRLMKRNSWSQGVLAKKLGKSRPSVNDMVKIAGLPEAIKQTCQTADTLPSKSALVELAKVGDPAEQLAIWHALQSKGKIKLSEARQHRQNTLPQSDAFAKSLHAARHFLKRLDAIEQILPENLSELLELRDVINQKINQKINGLNST